MDSKTMEAMVIVLNSEGRAEQSLLRKTVFEFLDTVVGSNFCVEMFIGVVEGNQGSFRHESDSKEKSFNHYASNMGIAMYKT